ncbi:hypothetical protein [Legionella oakridgensis]|uniref:Uncharacterized protein n=2 Tax=Legionella oakridgensis TaxID=29423 RepID=W0B8I4_9GAMM|nr:hypothetical protein [Legionella oakridgensis]AHE66180.1 hypothetical protein Loa_00610 [Legionella oakridgensis ATCC 33761 = DSM 21215]ETO94042.1 hypothetical protein LOR_52c10420 [Legionella oakridgensis RV-2-2007]KTD37289.1 hypothetical protein Loak_2425 [Legionella oakridgensis]STY16088.1 Uncharacterised protein [Legionella longbeachae]
MKHKRYQRESYKLQPIDSGRLKLEDTMKGILLLPILLMLTACGFMNDETIETQEVLAPPVKNKFLFVEYDTGIDVTHTKIKYN